MISISTFWRSLKYALGGIAHVFKNENSFRIQVSVTTLVFIAMIILPLETWQRILLILMAAAVLVLEMLNTIFERLSDVLKPRLHPIVKEIKDIMAGAVLITSCTAALVGVLIFLSFFEVI